MARARLRDRHQENLRKKLEVLIAEQGVTKAEGEVDVSQESSEISVKAEEPSSSSAHVEKNDDSQSE